MTCPGLIQVSCCAVRNGGFEAEEEIGVQEGSKLAKVEGVEVDSGWTHPQMAGVRVVLTDKSQ